MRETIEVGYQTFVADGDEEFGAIREISPDGLVVYVENAGEFRVPLDAVEAVHSQKVIFDCGKLDRRLRRAIGHAHAAGGPRREAGAGRPPPPTGRHRGPTVGARALRSS